MIQRIQTIYLFLAAVACVACMSLGIGRFYTAEGEGIARMYNLWLSYADGHWSLYPWALFGLMLVCATVLVFTIFLFRKRVRQIRLCTFSLVLQLGWYAAYAGLAWWRMNGMQAQFRPEWPAALPAIALVLTWLAMRGITRDELLVRSLDRLR